MALQSFPIRTSKALGTHAKTRRQRPFCPTLELLEARQLLDASGVYRSLDGTGNNVAHPKWGSTDEQLLRKAPAAYADGISTPRGTNDPNLPSAREISNALVAHPATDTPNDRNLTAYIYVWGQFLDHDLDLTTSASPAESFNIPVPAGDAYFDPGNTGTQVIPVNRSVYDPATGKVITNPVTNQTQKIPREQLNQITSWIDGSMIYGSDTTRAAALRETNPDGTLGAKLKVTTAPPGSDVGDLPPLNTAGFANANDSHRAPNDQLFLAGDVRANENIELTSLHTLFIREHNRQVDRIAAANPGMSDEDIYQQARAIVIAEIQSITYNEWLPALLGDGALKPYRGYNANVNPDIANEFSTAAFRLHTTINDDVDFFANNGRPITFDYTDDNGNTVTVDGEVALRDAFFNPTLLKYSGVDGILKYAASTKMEEMDNRLVDSLRNFLFGQPGQGGLDLGSLNIQRGRDHGLADYNTVRAAYGLPRVTSFSQISSDPVVQQTLQQLYKNVNNIDLWVGAMAEDHVRGSSAGPLVQRIMTDQFQRLRDGDRFWFEKSLSGSQLNQIEHTTLADIIERNTGVQGLQDNVFVFKAEVSGQVFFDRNGDGTQNPKNEPGVPMIPVELLNDAGDVIATTLTGLDGRYRFRQFGETGDFQVRVAVPSSIVVTTTNPLDILVPTGDTLLRGLNFGIHQASTTSLAAPFAPSMTSTSEPTTTTTVLDSAWDNDLALTSDAIRRYWDSLAGRNRGLFADDGV
jgi:peroxidase